MAHIACHVHISGLVQGVRYRASTQAQAQALGLVGWVRNLDDGRVEAFVQGPREQVARLLTWCGRGPERARVDAIDQREVAPREDLDGFRVLRP